MKTQKLEIIIKVRCGVVWCGVVRPTLLEITLAAVLTSLMSGMKQLVLGRSLYN